MIISLFLSARYEGIFLMPRVFPQMPSVTGRFERITILGIVLSIIECRQEIYKPEIAALYITVLRIYILSI